MPNHDHLQPVVGVALGLDVDFADQGAGGVNIDHFALGGGGRNRLGHAMCGKDHGAVIGAFIQFFDENSALIPQAINNVFVVHNLVPHVDWRPPFLECHFNDLDRTINARAKAAWRCKVKREGWFGHLRLRLCTRGKALTR